MFKKSAFLFTTLILLSSSLQAQTVIAKYAGEFMALGVGGRALGMGGAFVAVANDVTSGYYNPAGLANINYPQLSLMHSEQFGNLVNYDYGSVAIPFQNDMSFGLSIMRLGVDGIPDTRKALIDANNNGVIDINDNDRLDYSRISEFSNQDWAFYLTFAKRQTDDFYWGINAKIIRRDLAEFSATGIGFDVGAYYIPMENLFLGANLQDATTTLVAWSTGRNELVSPTLKVGAAYKVIEFLGGYIMPALDFDIRFENRRFASNFNVGPVSFDMHAGLEYTFKNLIYVRGGYNDVKQFTVGAGVKLPKLNIDYSFARFSTSAVERLDDSHRISIMLTLEEPRFLRSGI
ncbi:MAG: PorV/PorQ family protein [Ignavibacteriaceae bacterium]|nr:PorV/PorQ family protein [Ignavibacterium sp.]MCC6255252.1 PorV/PorQ family protein [Ignavibacteriaceae bacterium]HMN23978.1 PorV/PorQ family protein [Ignavibacteriaceae bacterium]HRN26121.1 PorV/PorQ family protein [Ignavibacteriaceae bacterium]HRP92585.1 PorV/PorQ family protein [Ignavibacteriaceae bacterium]